ncbi:MAG: DUF4251 domain-containing protein [Muribaculaceae bacterium]|nr:DUF4251 domain-containing protein [Muribaculaceae bacterium]
MKKIILSLIIACVGIMNVNAQDLYDELNTPTEPGRVLKEKQHDDADISELADSVKHKFAGAALRKGMFALTATRVDLGHSGCYDFGLNESTNFVFQQGNNAMVQVALNTADPGLNGFGGITCEGHVSNPKYREDKKGNIYYDFTVMGASISATVSITVYKGSNYAQAYVNPIFESSAYSITLYGNLVPYKRDQ